MLDINLECNALLLQQAIPGHCLKKHHPHKMAETIQIYSEVVQALTTQKVNENSTTHVNQWCNAVDRITDSLIEKRFVAKAKQLRSALLNAAQSEYLCHGDLHLENILQHGSHWLAIDPKGIIGDTTFEAAAFDLLSPDELKDSQHVTSEIIDRVEKLAITLRIDFNRLLAWIFLRTIISAQWFIEDKGEPNESLDQRLTLAKHVYPILRSSH
ncbi:MAG: aminoglycoside phosphotransferase family protein [Rickettsiella sp.]|nr:aminoglycoside phosphotransferase family protein [Rickettsiella sp.]